MDPDPEYWEGKRGACVGALYSTLSDSRVGVPPNGLLDICEILNESTNPQAGILLKTVQKCLK